jgi:CPA1 family monovalent cation:H+ antiporter
MRQPEFVAIQRELEAGRIPEPMARRARRQKVGPGETLIDRLVSRGRRHLADLDYLTSQPLGLAEAAVVIWAGMRGAVTVAAVQLLPAEAPHRPLLVFIAFAVATMSLLIQGGTIGILAKWLFPSGVNEADEDASRAERARIRALLDATQVPHSEGMSGKEHRLALCRARRIALLDAADEGTFTADALALALRDLDIDELVLELRSGEM